MIKSMFEHTPVLIGLVAVVGSLYACAFRRVRRERREKRVEAARMQGSPADRDGDHVESSAGTR
ncbi:hypothetical protein [uncultured Propionivibrio sp.]|uniref:hypothetical protein n=1 Tax=uncultured Propionivibrio sp. TaxID=426737 RepID=UPI0029BFDB74|nr:hypothetical protein [uncultured Propionivibrio sp.]